MAMEINGLNSSGNKTSASQGTASPRSRQTSSASSNNSSSSEQVNISAEARLLSQVASGLGADAPIDHDKVAALKAALADGSYQINADTIADKMLELDGKL